jgi:alpha-glucuronidase
MKNFRLPILTFLLFISVAVKAEDGHRLWLRYDKISNNAKFSAYRQALKQLIFPASSPKLKAAKKELEMGLSGLLDLQLKEGNSITADATLVIGTPGTSSLLASKTFAGLLSKTGNEGYIIKNTIIAGKKCTVIAANTETGVLYGVFTFLRMLQSEKDINNLAITDAPKMKVRILDHWASLEGPISRGYAGNSIWDWKTLPQRIDPIYVEYARANASVGINGSVLNGVNAEIAALSKEYIIKEAALANTFRPYGIKVYLSVRFSAPVELGGLKTADPLDPTVKKWWKDKADEIYSYIPDFGGFLVKANSEGEPGPQTYGRNHAEGANVLADALAPHKGIVMWRAFVYDNKVPDDRAKQAYNEFKPLDGKFRSNVIVQVKNGAIDFQPREPFHPLFGALPKTPIMMEFQITQEYLGFASHLVYLGTLFKETLDADTYAKGKGSTVAKVIDGSLEHHNLTGMAGVSNIGNDTNWTGHPFLQANWYVFGRLAWNPYQSAATIADDWIRMTFSNDPDFIKPVKQIMMESRENTVNYMTPLGLHHAMAYNTHHGPGPWVDFGSRPDWNSTYYHKADAAGIGFDRTSKGSNAVGQYFEPVRAEFDNIKTTPEIDLLWFHHVAWNYKMKSGRTLWDELVHHYYAGVDSVRKMQQTWNKMKGKIDNDRFEKVRYLMAVQEQEAVWWRNGCVLYFQTFSKMPIPAQYEKPQHDLEYYKKLVFKYDPKNPMR